MPDYVDDKKDSGFYEVLISKIDELVAVAESDAVAEYVPKEKRESTLKVVREMQITAKALASAWEKVDTPILSNIIGWFVKQIIMGPDRWRALLMVDQIEGQLEDIMLQAEANEAKDNGTLQ